IAGERARFVVLSPAKIPDEPRAGGLDVFAAAGLELQPVGMPPRRVGVERRRPDQLKPHDVVPPWSFRARGCVARSRARPDEAGRSGSSPSGSNRAPSGGK